MTDEEKWGVIQQHKDYISHPICSGRCDLEKGSKAIVGDRFDLSDRRLAKVKKITKWTIKTECGIVFRAERGWSDIRAEAEDGRSIYMFDIDVTYDLLNARLPIDEARDYLQWLTGCTKFQFGYSHYNWIVACWAGDRSTGSPEKCFLVRKHPSPELQAAERDRVNEYEKVHFPRHAVVLFEDVKKRRIPGGAQCTSPSSS